MMTEILDWLVDNPQNLSTKRRKENSRYIVLKSQLEAIGKVLPVIDELIAMEPGHHKGCQKTIKKVFGFDPSCTCNQIQFKTKLMEIARIMGYWDDDTAK